MYTFKYSSGILTQEQHDPEILTQERYHFYCDYRTDAYNYCQTIKPNQSKLKPTSEKLRSLGELQDFLSVLQQQSESDVRYSHLIELIGGLVDGYTLTKLLEQESGECMALIDDYKGLGSCNIASIIPKVIELQSALVVEIETDLGLPISAIDLIISSFSR